MGRAHWDEYTQHADTARQALLFGLLTCLVIVVVHHFALPSPITLIAVVVLSTGVGGIVPGAVSALAAVSYFLFLFATKHPLASSTDVNMPRVLGVSCAILGCYLVVAFLRRGRDKAAADAKLAELSQSMDSLLANMPLLTFSKDAATGRYLACNQPFAEYAHKASPSEVVGLTDHDIFDKETADHFVSDDKLTLSMDEPYIIFEDTLDAAGQPRYLQTTKIKFVDQAGRLCTLGVCMDVSELERIKAESERIQQAYDKSRYESMVYSHIASSLSADYTYVYCVNLETDEYVAFRGDGTGGTISEVVKSRDFFKKAYADVSTAIYEKDRDEFRAAFTKENIVRMLEIQGRFNLVYRLMVDGQPQYMSMKATRMTDDRARIVIGIMNIDAQMREKRDADRVREERIAYARINALSGGYVAVYSVDPETCHFQEYSASASYRDLSLTREGDDFFGRAVVEAEDVVYPGDLEKFQTLFVRENVMREIDARGIFALKYRLVMNNTPVHVQLNAALVQEADGVRLIVGVLSIDEQVRQEEEYQERLLVARALANRDELTGVHNKHAYAEREQELNLRIAGGEDVEFALVVLDVNDLKVVNDKYGHLAGDEHLKAACNRISNTFAHSPVFRIGGDEFAVVVQDADYLRLDELVGRIEEGNRQGGVVMACGMARHEGEPEVAAVFQKADQRMYENKRLLKS